jgi:CheY-like chemotaxis protein/HPt (histidine-containing phosphotransfer) domain-containing protein
MEPFEFAPSLHGRILIAEDGRDTLHLLRVVLERTGLEVDSAENGVVACQLVEKGRASGTAPDLILMDIQMPELDGFEALRRVRESGWKGPVIALTAHALADDRDKCLLAGFDDYVAKPVDRVRLLQIVARYLAGGASSSAPPPEAKASSRASGLLDDPRINPADRARILTGFIVRMQERANQIEQAISCGDLSVVLEAAHALHGSAGLFGFMEVAQTSHTVEEQIRAHASSEVVAASTAELVRVCRETAANFNP